MDPASGKTLTAIWMMDDAHVLMRRGKKCLGRSYPDGLTGRGDLILPHIRLGNDPMRHDFFMNPAGFKLITPTDLKKGDIKRLMGNIVWIQLHEKCVIGVMDMNATLLGIA